MSTEPEIEKAKTTPQELLMNCLAEAERIDQIIIIVFTKDGWYESWSNDLPTHVRSGLLHEAQIRCDKSFFEAKDKKE